MQPCTASVPVSAIGQPNAPASLITENPQAIPSLIAIHIGERYLALRTLHLLGEATVLETVATAQPERQKCSSASPNRQREGCTVMVDVEAIARHYGGKVCKGNALIPTPGHSPRDRGTAINACAHAPDGCLVACYNGTQADALAVKEMLRKDGFLGQSRARPRARDFPTADRRSIRQAELARKRERLEAEEAAAWRAADLWRYR